MHHQPHEIGHFYFFGNKEVTSLYFTIALVRFSTGLIGVFVPIYLWQLGYPLWQILLFYLLECIYYVVFGFGFTSVYRKMNDKLLFILSIPFFVMYFMGLSFLETYPVLFYILPFILVIRAQFFNVAYHLDFASASDDKDLGKEVGSRFMVGSMTELASPFLGGVLITFFGFSGTFSIASIIIMIAILPLLYFKKRGVSKDLTAKAVWKYMVNKKLWPYTTSTFGYANEVVIGGIIWKIFLFLSIGSYEQFGGVISFGLLGGAVVTFLAGMMSDGGRRKKINKISSGIIASIWALRIFIESVFQAVGTHLVFHLGYSALLVTWTSQYYHLAKKSPNPSAFILSHEIFLYVCRGLFIPILMLLSVVVTLEQFFIICFVFAVMFSLMFMLANKQEMKVFEKI